MAVLKPRTRVIFFRVSEEEFQQIEQSCGAVGARSVSDFARIAVRNLMSAGHDDRAEAMVQRLNCIDACLTRLHDRVRQIDTDALNGEAHNL